MLDSVFRKEIHAISKILEPGTGASRSDAGHLLDSGPFQDKEHSNRAIHSHFHFHHDGWQRQQVVSARFGFAFWMCLLAFAPLWEAGPTRAADTRQLLVRRIELRGARRTRRETLVALLPRKPPSTYTSAELREFERRVANLAIFDLVKVSLQEGVLELEVREKWTLIPVFDFATGKTWKDLYAELGAFEYNALGTGTSLGFVASYVQRGPNFSLAFNQHGYQADRWALGLEAAYETAELRFEDQQGWVRKRAGAGPYWSAPLSYAFPLRYDVGFSYYREIIDGVMATAIPHDGHEFALFMSFTWDRYTWHDLAPHGYSIALTLSPGWFIAPSVAQARSQITLELKAALRFTATTALMLRQQSGVGARGNPNYSFLLGSYEGVRGLDDAFYRNWIQTYLNLELRQALRIATRWALQAVLFTDGAAFESLDAAGKRASSEVAVASGGGLRVLPLWLSDFVLRFDTARLLTPERGLFFQFGVTQYF